MIRAAFALTVALAPAACSKTNDVTLLLGPTEDKISRGFLCRDAAGDYLMQRVFAAGALSFNLVVDVIDLEDNFPGCRGEELLALCEDPANCDGQIRRQCLAVSVPFPVPFDPTADGPALAKAFRTEVAGRLAMRDLPNNPVIIRAVATTEPCPTDGGGRPGTLDPDRAVGCAYSCPVQLDQIDGAVSVSLDVLNDFCEASVRTCTAFP